MLTRFFNFFKQETQFERFMLNYAENIEKAGEQFAAFIRVFDPKKVEDWIRQIKELEHICDDNTHKTMNWLESTFIVNYDREDIYRLASDLDDIVDFMDGLPSRG